TCRDSGRARSPCSTDERSMGSLQKRQGRSRTLSPPSWIGSLVLALSLNLGCYHVKCHRSLRVAGVPISRAGEDLPSALSDGGSDQLRSCCPVAGTAAPCLHASLSSRPLLT